MPKKNLAVQFPSIMFYAARGNEYVSRYVKCPLFCLILTNKLNSSTNFKILTTIVHEHPFKSFPFVSTNQRDKQMGEF